MPSETLLPCPFCGADAEFYARDFAPLEPPIRWGVDCSKCDCWCDFRAETKAEAAEQWNRRAAYQERDADALPCVWHDDGEYYATECGNAFTIIAGTPQENDMRYCCYCGREIADAIDAAMAADTQATEDDGMDQWTRELNCDGCSRISVRHTCEGESDG